MQYNIVEPDKEADSIEVGQLKILQAFVLEPCGTPYILIGESMVAQASEGSRLAFSVTSNLVINLDTRRLVKKTNLFDVRLVLTRKVTYKE